MSAPPLRCLLVWLAATALAGALVAWLTPLAGTALAGGGPADPTFDDLLVRLCAGVGVVGIGWLWVATSVTVLGALRGRAHRARGLPAPVRRLVLAACGAGLAAGLAAPAVATPGDVHTDHGPPTVLAGLPLPDRAVGLPGRAALVTDPSRVLRPSTGSVVVRPGDTLWDLASAHLGDPTRWPEIYALNHAAIGADPSLIQPATRLRLPADRPEETP
jgi:nucleoid-associated protein YgaU